MSLATEPRLLRPERLDELEVVVELRAAFAGKLSGAEVDEAGRNAEHLIKSYVGVTAKARIVPPGTIERMTVSKNISRPWGSNQ